MAGSWAPEPPCHSPVPFQLQLASFARPRQGITILPLLAATSAPLPSSEIGSADVFSKRAPILTMQNEPRKIISASASTIMNPFPSRASATLIASISLSLVGFSPAKAQTLYSIQSYQPSNLVNAPTDTYVGFQFNIAPGYTMAVNKLSAWLTDSLSTTRVGVTLQQFIASTSSWDTLLNVTVRNTAGSANPCTLVGSGVNTFCEVGDLAPTILSPGINYKLTVSYISSTPVENKSYLRGLGSSQVTFNPLIHNVVAYDNAIGPIPGANSGFFGPNLTGTFSAIPGPVVETPSPLPLAGASSAFFFSRSLRRRLNAHRA